VDDGVGIDQLLRVHSAKLSAPLVGVVRRSHRLVLQASKEGLSIVSNVRSES
jgi:hypothetical protein